MHIFPGWKKEEEETITEKKKKKKNQRIQKLKAILEIDK